MTSNELVDLLYVAYNRDEAEIFGIDKAIRSGYEELYTTAPDVLEKRMEVLDQEIEKQALDLINEKVVQVRTRKQQEIERKQARFGELIRERAEAILRENAAYLGRDTVNESIEMINEDVGAGVHIDSKENVGAGPVSAQMETDANTETNISNTKRRGRPKKDKSNVGADVLEPAQETKEEGGDTNVGEESKPKKRGRKPKHSAE